jgi:two-component system chemotaxis sensor kinase CheA
MDMLDLDRLALHRLFFEESEEGLITMEEALVALEQTPGDTDALHSLFRAAHTLKGNAQSLGFTELAALTHGLEDVLDRLRSGGLVLTREVIDLLLECVDGLRTLLAEAKG